MYQRTKDIQLSIIKQIELRANTYPDVISLAQGIPSFDTPECIKRRAEKAMKRGVAAKYSLSPGLPELRELIELSLAKENMYYDWQKEIIVTVGSIEAITAAVLAITEPGDEVLVPSPSYTSYRELITLSGCKIVYVPLDEDNGWSFDLEKFRSALTHRTRAILYCNPNNPTGTIYNKEQLLALGKLAEEHDLFIISDDVYKDFIFDDSRYFSLAEVPELRRRVIRTFSFSKAYAMTGWRVGYLHSDESVISEVLKVHDSLVTCAPVISQYAAMGALEMAASDVVYFRDQFLKRRDLVCGHLEKLSHIFQFVRPNSAYYIFPRINPAYNFQNDGGRGHSWSFALELLENIHVAAVPGVAFGPNGEDHIRLSFGREERDLNTAIERMDNYFYKK